MKNLLKIILSFSIYINAINLQARPVAEASSSRGEVEILCVYDKDPMALYDNFELGANAMSMPMCRDIEEMRAYMMGTAVALDLVSFGLACTGIGTTAVVIIQGASHTLKAAELYIKNVPCMDDPPEFQENRVRAVVCEELERNGVACLPERLVRKP
jgi:hypothetical protein